MSKMLGSVAPKERVNIKYVPATGDQHTEVELPLKLLITGDFKGHGELIALEDRQAVRIDKDNFNEVLAKAQVTLDMAVPSVLGNDTDHEALPLLPDIAAVARTCPEFEQLSRPLDNAPEQDPLRAFFTPAPARDVLDLPAPAQRPAKPVDHGPHPARQKAHAIAGNLRLGLLLLTCLSFSGCTLLGKVGQVILDPSIPVGGPNEQPSRYSLSLHASDDVNLRLISPGTAPHSPEDAHLSPYTLNVQANSPLALTNKLQTLLDQLFMQQGPQALPTFPNPPRDWNNENVQFNLARRLAPKVQWPAEMDLESRTAP